jgi:hypothetical protein
VDEDESLRPNSVSADSPSERLSPYDLLLLQSRKMGYLATKTYDVTREFLKKDVKTLTPHNPETILFGKQLRSNADLTIGEAKDINQLVNRSHDVLAGARTVMLPVNLFPDSVTVDRTKVTIVKRTFFWNSQVITTRIEDILNVTSNFGPFFGSLTISTRIMNSTDHYEINYFWRKDAQYLKQIIQGYMIAQHNKIATKHLSHNELIDTLLEIGRDSSY